ncbi:Adenylate and Guanylate cyclase catalytic domain containing protein [Novymonas esmeraldas]|uniref:Adenylate and Guanylate cyclase catalytic domain containing protein n=1 Tax=Novymonas esmeraldas TaxID=1808958 RepID=A0AAW0ETN3_9TRYP
MGAASSSVAHSQLSLPLYSPASLRLDESRPLPPLPARPAARQPASRVRVDEQAPLPLAAQRVDKHAARVHAAIATPAGVSRPFTPLTPPRGSPVPVMLPQALLRSPNQANVPNFKALSPLSPRPQDAPSDARRYMSVLSDSTFCPGESTSQPRLLNARTNQAPHEAPHSPSASGTSSAAAAAAALKRTPVVSFKSVRRRPIVQSGASLVFPGDGDARVDAELPDRALEQLLHLRDVPFYTDRGDHGGRRDSDCSTSAGFSGILKLPSLHRRKSSVDDASSSTTTTRSASYGSDCAELSARFAQHARAAVAAPSDTDLHVRTLQRCWEVVSRRSDDFIRDICAWPYLQHANADCLFRERPLKTQAGVMLRMIGEVLTVLTRSGDTLSTLLEIGTLHQRYGVDGEHFRALQCAFMEVLPTYLPAHLQIDCEAAWTSFWTTVELHIVQRAAPPRGDWHAARQQRHPQSPPPPHSPPPPPPLCEENQRVMEEVLYRRTNSERGLFIAALEQRVLLSRSVAGDSTVLSGGRTLSIHAFNAFVQLLEGAGDAAATVPAMVALCRREAGCPLNVAERPAIRQSFIDTCHDTLLKAGKPHLWGPRTASSLGAFWDYTMRLWETALVRVKDSPAAAPEERPPSSVEPQCLMFTGIECCAQLWERNPAVMGEAVEAHRRIVRSAIADHGAYEVKTIDDTFVIAAKDALIALKIALAIQLELMRGPITPGFEMVDDAQGSGPAECWRNDSLRVRIGIHYCRDVASVYHNVQRRFDYNGPSADGTPHMDGIASGGQIVMTQTTLDALREMPAYLSDSPCAEGRVTPRSAADVSAACGAALQALRCDAPPLADMVVVRDWGTRTFEGYAETVRLASLVPTVLAGRMFSGTVESVQPTRKKTKVERASRVVTSPPVCELEDIVFL